MKGINYTYKGRDATRIALMILLVIGWTGTLLISGCASGSYARMRISPDVTQAFETYHIYPGYRYYYLKQQNAPFAVLALRDDYSISSMSWYEFDADPGKLADVVNFARKVAEESYYPYGSTILGPQGEAFGYWYSGLRVAGIEIDKETKKVSIYTNTPWLDNDVGVFF